MLKQKIIWFTLGFLSFAVIFVSVAYFIPDEWLKEYLYEGSEARSYEEPEPEIDLDEFTEYDIVYKKR